MMVAVNQAKPWKWSYQLLERHPELHAVPVSADGVQTILFVTHEATLGGLSWGNGTAKVLLRDHREVVVPDFEVREVRTKDVLPWLEATLLLDGRKGIPDTSRAAYLQALRCTGLYAARMAATVTTTPTQAWNSGRLVFRPSGTVETIGTFRCFDLLSKRFLASSDKQVIEVLLSLSSGGSPVELDEVASFRLNQVATDAVFMNGGKEILFCDAKENVHRWNMVEAPVPTG